MAALLGVTAYLYRLTTASHVAALGLTAGLLILLVAGDVLLVAGARWMAGRRSAPAELPAPPAQG